MSLEDAFLHDILAHPDDDAPRLIYADWLDEHNDPRGEFIRVQCALALLNDEDPRRWPLEQREQELLREHEAKWLPKNIGHTECVFRRGFVAEIALRVQDFLAVGDCLFEEAPIQAVILREHTRPTARESALEGIGLRQVAQSPHLARLRGLSLAFPLDVDDLRSLNESPYLANLTDLTLFASDLHEDALIAWEGVIHRPTLRSLDLRSWVPSSVLRDLAETPHLANLRRLTLSPSAQTLDDWRVLANSSSLTSLRELNLNGNRLTHEAARVLAEGRLLPQLETLHLNSNLLGDAGAVTIREWPALPRLTRLSLGHNHIFAAGVQALAAAPALSGLISLDLFGNISCDAGAAALAFSSHLSRLRTLNLRFNGIGDEGVRALAYSETLSGLTRLNLTANRITSAGARALIESPMLSSLARLDLPRNGLAAAEQEMLRQRFGPFVTC